MVRNGVIRLLLLQAVQPGAGRLTAARGMAEQVDFPAGIQPQPVVIESGFGIGQRDIGKVFAVAAELVTAATRAGTQLRPQGAVHLAQAGAGLTHPCLGLRQIQIGLQCLLHQLAEGGIVKHRPPLRLYRLAGRTGWLEMVVRGQAAGRWLVIRPHRAGA